MCNWVPKKNVTLSAMPLINYWIQDLINNAKTYEQNVNLLHHLMSEVDKTDNRVRKHAFKNASELLYDKITGIKWHEVIFHTLNKQ